MFRYCRSIKRLITYCKSYKLNYTRFSNSNQKRFIKIVFTTKVVCASSMDNYNSKIKLEDDITNAIQEGEAAIITLMTQLKDFIITTSEEYRKCIIKQIEIVKIATFQQAGPNSYIYDDLPEYRTLASSLKKELTDYLTLFNTLVSMAKNKGSDRLKNSVQGEQLTEFEALQHVVEKELEQNAKYEKELLQAVTDSILHEVLFDPQ